MMKINQRKIGTILSYVDIFIQATISIIYTPIMIYFLGNAEFGVYNLSNSVISYLGLLSLGFGGAYVRFYYRYKTQNDELGIAKLNGLFISVYTIISIVALISGYILINNIEFVLRGKLTQSEIALSAELMKVLVINIALTFPVSVFGSYVTATENFIFQKIVSLTRHILNPLLGLPLLLLGYRSIGLSIAITLATVFYLIVNVFYCIKKLNMRFSIKNPDFILFKEIFIFSSFILFNMIVDQINWNLDKYIIGKFVGSISVAIYSIGAQINQYFITFSTSVSNVFIPRINEIVQSGKKNNLLTELFVKIGRIQYYFLMLILTGFIGVGRYFITSVWVGGSYKESFYIALILIFPMMLPLIQNIGIEIQRAKNLHKFRSILYIVLAIFNVIISIPLTINYGAIGSSIGTSMGVVIGNGIIMNFYYHYKVGLDMKYFWKSIGSASKGVVIPMSLAIFISIRGVNGGKQFIIFGIAIVTIYLLSVWYLSFNEYEKNLIKKPINKLFHRKHK